MELNLDYSEIKEIFSVMENPEFRSDENHEFNEESRDSVKLESIPRDSIEARDSRHSKCSAGHLSVQSDHSSEGFSAAQA